MLHKLLKHPLTAYTALALIILGPALRPGYILVLDMIFTPAMSLGPVPAWLIQKLMLITIFALAGFGMHRLAPTENPYAKYAAGLFFVLNPFTYERLMSGQYLVLAGYAILPWLAAATLRWMQQPTPRRAIPVAAWAVVCGYLSLHFFGFAFILIAAATLLAVIRLRRQPTALRGLAISAALLAGLTALASAPWLLPVVTGHSQPAQLIAGFDTRQFLSFRTEPDSHLGLPGGVLTLAGFWGERNDWFIPPKSAYWALAFAPIIALIITGAIAAWRTSRLATALILALLLLAWILAQGIMDNPFAIPNYWLYQHVPFYAGYREPGKFIALIALAEAYFLAPGVAAALAWLHRRAPNLVPTAGILLLALPWLFTPSMPWAAAGQLTSTNYPPDWYQLNAALTTTYPAGKVLVLPWHQYLYFDFAGRIIANPAASFFGPRIIQGDNPEIGLIARQTTDPTSTFIEQQILDPATARQNLSSRLAHIGVKYVVLLKTVDYANYSWLGAAPDLTLVQNTPTLELYQIK